jgi:ribosomal protein S6--L-glutamate ligase
LRFRGTTLAGFDAVIRGSPPRGPSSPAVLRQFEMMGCGRSMNRWRSGAATSSDACSFWRDGVGLPVTAFAHYTTKADEVIEIAGGAPVVIKLLEGTQGIGVVLGKPTSRPSR